ncbi:unnamed protein product [Spodoptera littoralis]|uniref:Cuticular protein n=1 Tax=Spodoptera littoralis TaxID=7109 RepID=A0A9P0ICI2_SPOLI|nr:unnamed protein product [Spodoptera littoralis]CAH1645413.1 unnamed protein product [Spodoptera littoralis]
MAGLKIVSLFALLSAASAGHLGHFKAPSGYSAVGSKSNHHSSATAAASASANTNNLRDFNFVPILNYAIDATPDGTYRYNYDALNGIAVHESGAPRAAGPEGLAVTVEGGFSYTAPDGQEVSLTYTADENGFHPVGSHIPTPPPIPEAILRSLQSNGQIPSS